MAGATGTTEKLDWKMRKKKESVGTGRVASGAKDLAKRIARSLKKQELAEELAEEAVERPPDPKKDAGYYGKDGVFRRTG